MFAYSLNLTKNGKSHIFRRHKFVKKDTVLSLVMLHKMIENTFRLGGLVVMGELHLYDFILDL